MWGVAGLVSSGLGVLRESCLMILISDLKNRGGLGGGSGVSGAKMRG